MKITYKKSENRRSFKLRGIKPGSIVQSMNVDWKYIAVSDCRLVSIPDFALQEGTFPDQCFYILEGELIIES